MRPEGGGWSSPSISPSPPPAPPPPPVNLLTRTRSTRSNCSRCHCQRNGTAAARTQEMQNSYPVIPAITRTLEDDESTCRALCERDLRSLHRNVPALLRADLDTGAIRQHFYPEGGWGWLICGAAFLAHVLCAGLQLSYGYVGLHADRHVRNDTAWIGPLSCSVSLLVSPLVVAVCRRKSTRLTAVLGGLVAALACLFASFATKLHQLALSYGVMLGVGAGMIRESALLMLGQYFRRRREFVEMVAMTGGGVGVALFSVVNKEAIGQLGWRLGMQVVTLLMSLCFFLGLLYRSASLYHPQRRAIVHLKNQRKKMKEKKTHQTTPKSSLIDFSSLRCPTVRSLMISAAACAAGTYSPVFYIASHGATEGLDEGALVLLQTSLGLALAAGCGISGAVLCRPSQQCVVSRLYLCEFGLVGIGASLLALSAVQGYHGLCMVAWLYGLSLGSLWYSMKMLVLERVRAKQFSRAWGFIQCAQSVPALLGVYVTGELNGARPRAGYYLSLSAVLLGSVLLFLIRVSRRSLPETPMPTPTISSTQRCLCRHLSVPQLYVCQPSEYTNGYCIGNGVGYNSSLCRPFSNGITKSLSFASPADYYYNQYRDDYFMNYNNVSCTNLMSKPMNGCIPNGCDNRVLLRPSKSVPEGLCRRGTMEHRPWQRSYSQRARNVHLIEQITTSV